MRQKILQYIQKHGMIKKGDRILVAVSGGPDSISLLHILKSIQKEYQLELMVLHVNHLLRGWEAEEDQEYVKNLCKDWGIPCYIQRTDVKKISEKKGISIEEAGREVRYDCFYEMKERFHLQKIALGQHGDDNAETVLMRMIRGTGPQGLAGIPPHRKDGIIRPLLSCSREEIETYCRKHQLYPRIDESNLEPIYFRNKIRLEIIPYLEQYNSNIKLHLQHLAEIMTEQQEYIQQEIETLWRKNIKKNQNSILLSVGWLCGLTTFQQKEMLRKSIKWVKNNLKEIEFTHIRLIIEKLHEEEKTIWILHLPEKIRVERRYGQVIIKKEDRKQEKISFCCPLSIGKRYHIPELNKEFHVYLEKPKEIDIIKNNTNKFYFDYEKVGTKLLLRNRRSGDKFQPLHGNGTKKLKDYFIDLKVPKEKRDKIPIIVGKKGIIWVVGYQVDKKYIVDQDTKTVLTIQYVHKEEKDYGNDGQ